MNEPEQMVLYSDIGNNELNGKIEMQECTHLYIEGLMDKKRCTQQFVENKDSFQLQLVDLFAATLSLENRSMDDHP